MSAIARSFNTAAPRYHSAAPVQAQIAERLVGWAAPAAPPAEILDIGSGTGLVAAAALRRWPAASVTAFDSAPAMLREAQRKIPGLRILSGDAASLDPAQKFDAIFSSMVLHWLPDPAAVLRRWQGWLKPGGNLYIALLTDGSFREWRNVCAGAGLKDGLWVMPRAGFADAPGGRTEAHTLAVTYSSVSEFLHRLKATGAAVPRAGHAPFGVPAMRRLLGAAPKPFTVSYETLFIELTFSSGR